MHKCLEISTASLFDAFSEQRKTSNIELYLKVLEESEDRDAAYLMLRPQKHNGDPA